MDKHEYRMKTDQMLKYYENRSYGEAYEIAETIDWNKVKNVSVLNAVSEIYEYNGDLQKGRDILFLAYERSPESKKIVYRLGTMALKMGEIQEAMDCYDEFVQLAPKDPNRFILKYKILKSKNAPISEQIEMLEQFKQVEYVEKWAFELAMLYEQAGMISECLEECDDLIVWFSEGTYIYKAMELKMQYKPLTPLQQEKYNNRFTQAEEAPKAPEEAPEEATVEEAPEFPAEDAVAEEPVTEEPLAEEPLAEEPSQEETEEVQEEAKPTMSIEEMVQDWEEKQKENAQIIQAEIDRAEQEKEENEEPAEPEEKEEILSDDIRKLMEELEAESAEIDAQKSAPEEATPEAKPFIQKVAEQLTAKEGPEELPKPETEVPSVAEVPQEVEVPEEEQPIFEKEAFEKVIAQVNEEAEKEPVDDGIKLGDTQSIAQSTKSLSNTSKMTVPLMGAITPPILPSPVVPKPTPIVPRPISGVPFGGDGDKGFVRGRYDLEAQSEVGTLAGLTEEQKKIFSYFVPVHGMSEQLVAVLQADKECKSRYGTSRIGNIVIVGRRGSGKTVLAVNIIKAIQAARRTKQGKVAIVKAESLNKKNVREISEKLDGGALVIERAARLQRKTIDNLCELMEGQTKELLVIMEDERKPMERLLSEYPNFAKKFTSRVEVPVFINDELVAFGQVYAKENGYKIDDMGVLALYSDIDILQREEKVVTVSDVKELIDDAIDNANRFSIRRIAKKLFGRDAEESDLIVLKESDFR